MLKTLIALSNNEEEDYNTGYESNKARSSSINNSNNNNDDNNSNNDFSPYNEELKSKSCIDKSPLSIKLPVSSSSVSRPNLKEITLKSLATNVAVKALPPIPQSNNTKKRRTNLRNTAGYQSLANPYSSSSHHYTSLNKVPAQPPPQNLIKFKEGSYTSSNHIYRVPSAKSFASAATESLGKSVLEKGKCYANEGSKRSTSLTVKSGYKPYTLRDYQNMKHPCYEGRGGLGANIGTTEWKAKKKNYDKVHEFAKSVNQINKLLYYDGRNTAIKASSQQKTMTVEHRIAKKVRRRFCYGLDE